MVLILNKNVKSSNSLLKTNDKETHMWGGGANPQWWGPYPHHCAFFFHTHSPSLPPSLSLSLSLPLANINNYKYVHCSISGSSYDITIDITSNIVHITAYPPCHSSVGCIKQ